MGIDKLWYISQIRFILIVNEIWILIKIQSKNESVKFYIKVRNFKITYFWIGIIISIDM